jgi:hypothetical protein
MSVLHTIAQSTPFNQWRDFFGVSGTISSLYLHARNMPTAATYHPQNWQVPGKRDLGTQGRFLVPLLQRHERTLIETCMRVDKIVEGQHLRKSR